jgi:hypothetical protein
MAVFCCAICGYSFPLSHVITRQGRKKLSEVTYVWDCEDCVKDDGLAETAAERGYRTRWHRTLSTEVQDKWGNRGEQHDEFVCEKPVNIGNGAGSFRKSLAALYRRRAVARGFNLKIHGLNRYDALTDSMKIKRPQYWERKDRPSWEIHDEHFYENGYDIPLPRFLQNANRAAYLGLSESQLLPWDRVEEHRVKRLKRKARDAALEQSSRQRLQGNDPAKKVCYQDIRREMHLAETFGPPPPGYT